MLAAKTHLQQVVADVRPVDWPKAGLRDKTLVAADELKAFGRREVALDVSFTISTRIRRLR